MTILVTMISIPFIFHVPTLENIITFDKRIFPPLSVEIDLCLAQSRSVLLDHQFMGVVYYRVYNIDPCPAESVLLDQRFPLCSHQRDSGLLGASLFPPTPLPPSLPHPSSAHTTTPPSPPPSPPHTTGHP